MLAFHVIICSSCITSLSVEVNIYIYNSWRRFKDESLFDDEIDIKIDVTAMKFLLVQNRHQTQY